MRDEDFDALMTAITDEPVPDGALRDPDAAAAHAAAVADVALLRERLGAVGDTLAARDAPPAARALPFRPAPFRPARPAARRRLTVALGAVAATVAAAMVGGLAWLVVDTGPGASDSDAKGAAPGAGGHRSDGGADLSAEGFVACSRLIVEGTVSAVDPVPGGLQERVTVDVTRYVKPESGSGTVTFPMDRDAAPRLKTGDRVLVTVDKGSAEPANWAVGKERDRLRAMIRKALAASEKIRCDGDGDSDGDGPGPGG
ncbi:hypothetical protein ABZ953_02820 [Streptomyces sp. NPDC046465]|uniref:hypothetical protein n=1 Tax=Streptomyces sp. NPDC046465 TaxID=3155810 RepID=UPI0034060D59